MVRFGDGRNTTPALDGFSGGHAADTADGAAVEIGHSRPVVNYSLRMANSWLL